MGGEGRGPNSPRWRCFLAIDPTGDVVRQLNATIDPFRRTDADVRWVREAGLHLTLAFLGSVEVDRLAAVEDAVRGAVTPFAPIEMEVRGLGAFPNLRRPRALWAGVRAEGLARLAAAISAALEPLGFPAEKRAFRAHVTIGRVRSQRGWRQLEPRFRAAEDTEFGRCKARGVTAYRSDLRADGAVYTKLWTAEMGERDGDSD